MRKTVIIVGITVWGILALAALALLIAFMTGHNVFSWKGDGPMFNFGGNTVLIHEQEMTLDGIDRISFDTTYQSVDVTVTDGQKLTIRHYDYEGSERFNSDVGGGKLTVTTKKKIGLSFFGFGLNNWPRLEIEVPRSYADAVSFTSASGSVKVGTDAAWSSLLLKSTSGSVKAEGSLDCGDIQVSSTSGSVRLYGSVKGEEVRLSSTSGSVHIDGSVHCGGLTVQSVSGSVHVAECDVSGEVTLKTTSGSVHAAGIRAAGITASSMSGSLNMGELDAEGMIQLTSTSGSVKADAARSPEHFIKTTSGSIRVGELTGTGEVKSTSGSVKTNF